MFLDEFTLFLVLLDEFTLADFSVFGWIYTAVFRRIYAGCFQWDLHWLFLVLLDGFTQGVFTVFGCIYTVFLMPFNGLALTVSSAFEWIYTVSSAFGWIYTGCFKCLSVFGWIYTGHF